MSSEGVEATLKEVDKVIKKQKTCSSKTGDALSKLIKALEKVKTRIQSGESADACSALAELQSQVAKLDTAAQLANETKELHGAVSKLGKVVDRYFSTDVCKAACDVDLASDALNQVIAEHLFHEGLFEIGDCFVAEAGLPNGDRLKRPYESMHTVLQEIQRRNLQPALEWVAEHRAMLGQCSSFEFSLHTLAFLQTLKDRGQMEALSYARRCFPPFQRTHLPHIQRLMGALCFAKRAGMGGGSGAVQPHVPTPYADLFQLDELWGALARDFVRQSCALLGQAQDSPLLVTVAAGSAALPTLLKLANVKAVNPGAGLAAAAAAGVGTNGGGGGADQGANGGGGGGELDEDGEQLPVEIPLGREFVFHSIFACPVSREQSSATNPPWMLPCGHVMCKQSVLKVAKTATRPFKCPYCPQEATPRQCMEIIFPDIE